MLDADKEMMEQSGGLDTINHEDNQPLTKISGNFEYRIEVQPLFLYFH